MRGATVVAVLTTALFLVSCGQEEKPAPRAGEPGTGGATAPSPTARGGDPEKGRQIYVAHCAVCHSQDPAKDGPVGPAVKGAGPELVELRVVKGAYPSGYKPKRDSKVMPPRPDLAGSVPDLIAYLR